VAQVYIIEYQLLINSLTRSCKIFGYKFCSTRVILFYL